jgi:hypothetical protein
MRLNLFAFAARAAEVWASRLWVENVVDLAAICIPYVLTAAFSAAQARRADHSPSQVRRAWNRFANQILQAQRADRSRNYRSRNYRSRNYRSRNYRSRNYRPVGPAIDRWAIGPWPLARAWRTVGPLGRRTRHEIAPCACIHLPKIKTLTLPPRRCTKKQRPELSSGLCRFR